MLCSWWPAPSRYALGWAGYITYFLLTAIQRLYSGDELDRILRLFLREKGKTRDNPCKPNHRPCSVCSLARQSNEALYVPTGAPCPAQARPRMKPWHGR